jgi:hypothetical protein
MTLKSKKVAQRTTQTPNEDPDPMGFGTTLAELVAELKDAYHTQLRAFLLKFLLVRLEAAVRRRILEARPLRVDRYGPSAT